MQQLDLSKPKQIKVVYDGQEYMLSKPKLSQALEVEKSIKALEMKGEGSTAAVVKLLSDCGLPEEVVMDLEIEALEQVVTALMPPKKK